MWQLLFYDVCMSYFTSSLTTYAPAYRRIRKRPCWSHAWVCAAVSGIALQYESRKPKRLRTWQASLPHNCYRICVQGRAAVALFWCHGRLHAATGPGSSIQPGTLKHVAAAGIHVISYHAVHFSTGANTVQHYRLWHERRRGRRGCSVRARRFVSADRAAHD